MLARNGGRSTSTCWPSGAGTFQVAGGRAPLPASSPASPPWLMKRRRVARETRFSPQQQRRGGLISRQFEHSREEKGVSASASSMRRRSRSIANQPTVVERPPSRRQPASTGVVCPGWHFPMALEAHSPPFPSFSSSFARRWGGWPRARRGPTLTNGNEN